MSGGLTGAKLRTARALIARSAGHQLAAATLGTVTLRLDQRVSAARVRSHLARDGGCVLANEVGTGKTYVALAIAREWQSPLIIVPASLRATWVEAMRRAGCTCAVVTHESLSRGGSVTTEFDGIIVDESHRFRGTARRHAALATLAARVPVLLLSATPMQNRVRELADQVALFVGDRAYELDERELARHVVRDLPSGDGGLPEVAPPRWLSVSVDDGEVLRAILALPPPPRAADAGDGGALLVISLVRAWASSRAALAASIRRRQRILAAIEQCHAEARRPTTRELKSWQGEEEVQLGFASLLAGERIDPSGAAALAGSIAGERVALRRLRELMVSWPDPDAPRAACLLHLRETHPGASILAFSERASTVRAYHRALRCEPGVGLLTARECRIASGRIARQELLERFAPRAQGARTPAAHDRVTLLIATDLLSEGVNLQDASVVVHLDLPWNPARLVQRLGRARRPHGAAEVFSYLIAPPAAAASLLRIEERLRAKLHAARRAVGRELDVLPLLAGGDLSKLAVDSTAGPQRPPGELARSIAECLSEIDDRLRGWRRSSGVVRAAKDRCVVAAVSGEEVGWVAAVDDGRLLAAILIHATLTTEQLVVSDDPAVIARTIALADGAPRAVYDAERQSALAAVTSHLREEWTSRMCGVQVITGRSARAIETHIERWVAVAPRHERPIAVDTAARLRRAMQCANPLGVERALLAHCRSGIRPSANQDARPPAGAGHPKDAMSWLLRAMEIVGDARGARSHSSNDGCIPRPVAVLLVGPARV